MGGNIGLPILGQDPLPEGGVYVLELSSYQIDLTQSLDCDVAVLLNITPDHLDRYDELRSLCRVEGAAVRDAVARTMLARRFARRGRSTTSRHRRPKIAGIAGHRLDGCRRAAISRTGRRCRARTTLQNAAAAVAVVRALGHRRRSDRAGARAPIPACRTGWSGSREKDGVLFVNDSKATNPTATAPALAAFPSDPLDPRRAGQDRQSRRMRAASSAMSRAAYTIGEAGRMFARLLVAAHAGEQSAKRWTRRCKRGRAEAASRASTCCCRRPARRSTSSGISRRAGDAFRELVGAL